MKKYDLAALEQNLDTCLSFPSHNDIIRYLTKLSQSIYADDKDYEAKAWKQALLAGVKYFEHAFKESYDIAKQYGNLAATYFHVKSLLRLPYMNPFVDDVVEFSQIHIGENFENKTIKDKLSKFYKDNTLKHHEEIEKGLKSLQDNHPGFVPGIYLKINYLIKKGDLVGADKLLNSLAKRFPEFTKSEPKPVAIVTQVTPKPKPSEHHGLGSIFHFGHKRSKSLTHSEVVSPKPPEAVKPSEDTHNNCVVSLSPHSFEYCYLKIKLVGEQLKPRSENEPNLEILPERKKALEEELQFLVRTALKFYGDNSQIVYQCLRYEPQVTKEMLINQKLDHFLAEKDKIDAHTDKIRKILAQHYNDKHEYKKALDNFLAAAKHDSSIFLDLKHLPSFESSNLEAKKVFEDYAKTLEDKSDTTNIMMLGVIYLRLGNKKEAVKYFTAIAENSCFKEIQAASLVILADQKSLADSEFSPVELYRSAVKLAPKSKITYARLANYYNDKGNYAAEMLYFLIAQFIKHNRIDIVLYFIKEFETEVLPAYKKKSSYSVAKEQELQKELNFLHEVFRSPEPEKKKEDNRTIEAIKPVPTKVEIVTEKDGSPTPIVANTSAKEEQGFWAEFYKEYIKPVVDFLNTHILQPIRELFKQDSENEKPNGGNMLETIQSKLQRNKGPTPGVKFQSSKTLDDLFAKSSSGLPTVNPGRTH